MLPSDALLPQKKKKKKKTHSDASTASVLTGCDRSKDSHGQFTAASASRALAAPDLREGEATESLRGRGEVDRLMQSKTSFIAARCAHECSAPASRYALGQAKQTADDELHFSDVPPIAFQRSISNRNG